MRGHGAQQMCPPRAATKCALELMMCSAMLGSHKTRILAAIVMGSALLSAGAERAPGDKAAYTLLIDLPTDCLTDRSGTGTWTRRPAQGTSVSTRL